MVAETAEVFTPSAVQRAIYWDDRPTLVFVSTRGGGKTTAMVLRIRGMVERGEIGPGERIMLCGPDYTQLMDGTVKTFDYWFEDLITHKVDGNKPKRVLNGNIEVLCRSAMNPDQTRSKEVRVILLDEVAQMPAEMLELANMNLRPTGVRPANDKRVFQCLMSTTPRGMNWFYRRFGKYVLDKENDDPEVGAYHTTMMEAHREGVVTDDYLARAMQTYPPGSTKWRQEAEGEFVSWSGLVYRQDYHLIGPEHPLPKLEHVAAAIDVGSVTPSCVLVGGTDARGAIYIFKEYYQPRALLSDLMNIAGEWTREFHIRSWDVDNDLLWKMMKNGGMHAKPPNKTKDAAGLMVEYINDLMARGMYHIDPSCTGLISEMARYEYKDNTSGDEVTFLDTVKPNQDDHACLVAETVVLTEHGDDLINRVREGDHVLTRRGFRRVRAAGMTDLAAEVFEVALSNEDAIQATANHPFWVEGKGWTRLDRLTPGDILLSLLSCDDQNPLPSTASSSTVTRTQNGGRIASTLLLTQDIAGQVWADSTRKSGRRNTDQSREAITSTTSTATRSTTPSATSSAYLLNGTEQCTLTDGENAAEMHSGLPIWSAYGPSRKPGTPRWRAAHGMPRMDVIPCSPASRWSEHATSAERDTNLSDAVHPVTARTTASPLRVVPAASMTSNGHARRAGSSSPSIVTPRADAAPVRVVSVSAVPGKHPVYNLTIDGEPEFYANGVLVHNCDTMRYLVKRLSAASAAQSYGKSMEFAIG